jgi:hypothetical protein
LSAALISFSRSLVCSSLSAHLQLIGRNCKVSILLCQTAAQGLKYKWLLVG